MHQGLTYHAVQARVPTYYPKGCYDPRYFYEVDNPLGIPIVDNMLVLPLIYQETTSSPPLVLGALQFFNRVNPTKDFYALDLSLCRAVAGLVAGILNITNSFVESWSIIYEFKKRSGKIVDQAVLTH